MMRSWTTRGVTGRSIARWPMQAAALFVITFTAFWIAPAQAQNQAALARFPEPNQVLADFNDDPSRYAALTVLYYAVDQKIPPPNREAYQKSVAYTQAFGQVESKYGAPGSDSQGIKDFSVRASQLLSDPNFKRSVLEKYHLADLPDRQHNAPAQAQRSAAPVPSGAPQPTVDDDSMLMPAVPYWIATLVVMWFLPRLMLPVTARLTSSSAPETDGYKDPSQLPESLRSFRLVGAPYELGIQSGQVIEEKTWSETHVSVSTTAGNEYTPAQTHSSSVAIQKDRIWVRTLDGGEAAWTFSGGGFIARQGQILSGISRHVSGGNWAFLVAYNHTTNQFEIYQPSAPGDRIGTFFPWVVTTLVGTAGFVFGASKSFQFLMGPAGNSVTGATQALMIAISKSAPGGFLGALIIGRICVSLAKGSANRRRMKRFEELYKPAFLRFLQQSTPALVQRLKA